MKDCTLVSRYANYCKIRKHRKLKIKKLNLQQCTGKTNPPPPPKDVLLLIHYCQNKTRNHWSQDHNHLSYLYHASFTHGYWSHWFLHFLSYFPLLLSPSRITFLLSIPSNHLLFLFLILVFSTVPSYLLFLLFLSLTVVSFTLFFVAKPFFLLSFLSFY